METTEAAFMAWMRSPEGGGCSLSTAAQYASMAKGWVKAQPDAWHQFNPEALEAWVTSHSTSTMPTRISATNKLKAYVEATGNRIEYPKKAEKAAKEQSEDPPFVKWLMDVRGYTVRTARSYERLRNKKLHPGQKPTGVHKSALNAYHEFIAYEWINIEVIVAYMALSWNLGENGKGWSRKRILELTWEDIERTWDDYVAVYNPGVQVAQESGVPYRSMYRRYPPRGQVDKALQIIRAWSCPPYPEARVFSLKPGLDVPFGHTDANYILAGYSTWSSVSVTVAGGVFAKNERFHELVKEFAALEGLY
jgi:hypothetical protein